MTETPLRIGIMICTAQRPQMLENCLKSLITQDAAPNWQVEICVVENDDDLHSHQAIERVSQASPFPILHVLETRRGIPFARNRTLQEALDRNYDWIALIDDDEVALDGWLKGHMEAVKLYGADVSYGPVTKTYEKTPPDWWYPDVPNQSPAGEVLKRASTNNVLFSSAIIRPPASLLFNEKLLFGYEDLDFFETAHAKGFKIVWSPDALVDEEVMASRVDAIRLLNWCRSSAAAHAQVSILRKGYWRSFMKFGLKGLRRIIGGGLGAGLLLIPAKLGSKAADNRFYKFRMRIARGLGNIQGLLNTPYHYYEQIDGR
ncbi:glycosyltransferase family 2 protein [Roseibium sp.]|uniref:glycosyltransferase family 2 protein n=1 Tax=Roseibium sp. TaxID=1936156 RepID=UPI003A983165